MKCSAEHLAKQMLAARTILTIKENNKALCLARTATLQRPQGAGPQIQQMPLQTNWLETWATSSGTGPDPPLASGCYTCSSHMSLSCCFLDSSSWPLNNVHLKPQCRLWPDASADLNTSSISGITGNFLGVRSPILRPVISQRFSLHHHMTETCLSPGPDRNLPARHQAKESSRNLPQTVGNELTSEVLWEAKWKKTQL